MTTNYEIVDLNDEENKVLLKLPRHNFIWYNNGNGNIFLPHKFLSIEKYILNMTVRSDDIWVTSYPKAGTTWAQEMVWCIMNDLDFKKAEVPLYKRFPYLEVEMMDTDKNDFTEGQVEGIENLSSPRFIKSHLPWNLLPEQIQNGFVKAKIIYVARNPKDVCASFYNHYQILRNFQGSLEEFCELFINNKVVYGSFFYHVESFLKNKHRSNLLIIKYEDMKKDLPDVIRTVANFLDKALTERQIEQLTEHLSFEKMKRNPAVNYEDIVKSRKIELRAGDKEFNGLFMNKGQVGYAKKILPAKYVQMLDEQCKKLKQKTHYNFD